MPAPPLVELDGDHRIVGRFGPVLRVLVGEQHESSTALLAALEHLGPAAQVHPPKAGPILLVVVDQDGDDRIGANVVERFSRGELFGLRSTAE